MLPQDRAPRETGSGRVASAGAGNRAETDLGWRHAVAQAELPVEGRWLGEADLEGNIVQTATTVPLKTSLTTGDQIGFKFQVDKPNSFARRIKVTFQEAKEGAAQ